MGRGQVTCIRKRGDHYSAHERIEGIGGSGWSRSEDQAISDLDSGANSFFTLVGGAQAEVVVATHLGRRYLKTSADGVTPDNLLSLPECP
jgi:hypothetical protein